MMLSAARAYRLDRQQGQPVRLEVMCESAGMVPQLAAVADPFGVPVRSGGGFTSLPGKRNTALRAADSREEVRVLVVSDWDASGAHLFTSLAEDCRAFAAVEAPGVRLEFERIAVTELQIADYRLPTAPPKVSDRRSFAGHSTTQAEALPPDVLAAVVRGAIEQYRDMGVLRSVLEREAVQRQELLAKFGEGGGQRDGAG